MGALKALVLAVGVLGSSLHAPPCRAESVADWQPFIQEASLRFGIPTAWIERVMQAESRGRTTWRGRPTRSRAGAMGLMQVMPATWAEMRYTYGLKADPYDPHDNILAGTAYLRLMYDRFGYPGLFAAYNAGPRRYADYLDGRALPAETRTYLVTVAGTAPRPERRAAKPKQDRLFVATSGILSQEPQPAGQVMVDPLFAFRGH